MGQAPGQHLQAALLALSPTDVNSQEYMGFRLLSDLLTARPRRALPQSHPAPPPFLAPGEQGISQSSPPNLDFLPPTKEKPAPPSHFPHPTSHLQASTCQQPVIRTQLSHCPQELKARWAPLPGHIPCAFQGNSALNGGGAAGPQAVPEGAGPVREAGPHALCVSP